jgi:hypothetical protein
LLDGCSRKIVNWLEGAWDKGSAQMKFFWGMLAARDVLLLERDFAPRWGVR